MVLPQAGKAPQRGHQHGRIPHQAPEGAQHDAVEPDPRGCGEEFALGELVARLPGQAEAVHVVRRVSSHPDQGRGQEEGQDARVAEGILPGGYLALLPQTSVLIPGEEEDGR